MLANIHNYNKENQYNQAVFLTGAGHKKSIIQKIHNTKTSQKFIRLMKSVSSSSCPKNRKTDRTQVRGQEMEKQ